MERPEHYRWNSLGYHIQTGNKDNFLSLDFGLVEFGVLKEFVSINYQRFKDIFMSKREKIPKAVAGLDGVYSLKRLSEAKVRPNI